MELTSYWSASDLSQLYCTSNNLSFDFISICHLETNLKLNLFTHVFLLLSRFSASNTWSDIFGTDKAGLGPYISKKYLVQHINLERNSSPPQA